MKEQHYTKKNHWIIILSIVMMTSLFANEAAAQGNENYMRIASIVVDSTQLDSYITALKEQMQSALKLEPGVLAYSAVQDKKNPAHITILETYASVSGYEAHIQTEHFKKYKATVANMVKSLELNDVLPIAVKAKPLK